MGAIRNRRLGLLVACATVAAAIAGVSRGDSIFDINSASTAPAPRPVAVPPAPPPPPADSNAPINPPEPATQPATEMPIASVAPINQAKTRPIPNPADQEKSRKLFKQVYAIPLTDHSPSGRMALSLQLVLDAAKAADVPADEFVMLIGARQAGIESGDVPTAVDADRALCEAFLVDPVQSRLELFTKLGGTVQTPENEAALVKSAMPWSEAALEEGQFDAARQLADIAATAAGRDGDPTLIAASDANAARMRSVVDAFAGLAPALEALKKNPGDPEANQAVGRFYCFLAGEWAVGLPHLAAGPKGDITQAAKSDLAGANPLAIAEAWKAQLDHVAPAEKPQVRLRSVQWLRAAIGSLSQEKAKAEDELSALAATDSNSPGAGNLGHFRDLMHSMNGSYTSFTNGIYVLHEGEHISTKQKFVPPVAFRIVVQTDSTNIRLAYAADQIIFNWEDDVHQLRIDGGPAAGRHKPGAGHVPVDTWVTIDLIVRADSMTISVDGEERYTTEADFSGVHQALSIGQAANSTVQVKSVGVIQLH